MSASLAPTSPSIDPLQLREKIEAFKAENPRARARDVAAQLGVSEAELVACRVGLNVTRLDTNWKELVETLPKVGEVMVLTRNEHCVHEKVGTFDKVRVSDRGGIVLDPEIDLRLFFEHWASAFHVAEETEQGPRHSIQIFDPQGVAVHKVYSRPETDLKSFDALVGMRRADGQEPGLVVQARTEPAPDPKIGYLNSSPDAVGLKQRWEALKDTHDFFPMLKEFNVERVQALELVEGDFTSRVQNGAFQRALELAAERDVPIMVFVPNKGMIQIHTGPVHSIEEMGPWINVLDERFNLHLRNDAIQQSWVVRKPSVDGEVSSLEIFDENREQIAWMFGARKPGSTELTDWRDILRTVEQEMSA